MTSHRDIGDALLAALPTHISSPMLLKAIPKTEGADRFVYLEASSEEKDQQNEVILAKALAASQDYYLKFGNLDLDHYTQIGAKQGIPNYESFEIGVPVAVRIDGKQTFVKGHIKSGTGPAAEKANLFWSSITEVNPPERWYPSVGGAVTGKEVRVDASTGEKVGVINAVRWTNIGFSKTPVNDKLATVSTVPIGLLAKSWDALDLQYHKSLIAGGAGTDVANFTGGAAMGAQSLEGGDQHLEAGPHGYWLWRHQITGLLSRAELRRSDPDHLVDESVARFGLSRSEAAMYVEQFLDDLKRKLKGKQP